jgi:hypothetical protein
LVKFSFYSQMLDMGRCAVCLHPILLTGHKRFLSRFSQRIDWLDVTRDNSTPVKIFTAPSSTFHLLIMHTLYYTIQYDISRLWHPNPIKVTKENWSSRRAGNVSFSFFFSFFLNFHVLVDSPLGSRRSTGAFNKRKIQKIRRSDTQRRSNGRTAKIWNLQAVVIS